MGNPISKIGSEIKEEPEQKGSLPSTPILTPKILRSEEEFVDPRSPSANITRTPIELSPLTDYTTKRIDETLKCIEDDPRSPTTEFTRTPIMVYNKGSKSDTVLQYRGGDNVRKTLLCNNAYKALTQEKLKDNGPKLIEASTRIIKQSEKRQSFVGLLETNLDFQETDLDNVIMTKQKLELTVTPTIPVFKNVDADPRSPTVDFIRTPIQIVKKIGEIDINRDSSSDNEREVPDTVQQDACDDLQNISKEKDTNNEECTNQENLPIQTITPENTQRGLKEHITQTSGRKPLGQCDGNTANGNDKNIKLKVNDKPTKRLSKIPICKSKIIKGKFQACENTPPENFKNNTKRKQKSEWDANKSIII